MDSEERAAKLTNKAKIGILTFVVLLSAVMLLGENYKRNQCVDLCKPFCDKNNANYGSCAVERNTCYCQCDGLEGSYYNKSQSPQTTYTPIGKVDPIFGI